MTKDGKQKQLIIYNDELRKKLKDIDIKIVQQMFSGIRKQLRKIADNGPYEACSS